ncbi:EF-hand domain-containing family member B-like [Montipora capricornis]|uniref:EF-hand domain-containing family member B-like n=1 Tax=Montipora capricornis TaxID=246305 RepID=UPI0035F1143A
MLSNTGRFVDRNPGITAAGKLFNVTGETSGDCLQIAQCPTRPETVKKFRGTTQPKAGKERVFYGRANDPDVASQISHGVSTKTSLVAGDLVNPTRKSLFSQRMLEKKESLYASRRNAPLGSSHDQRPGLPKGIGRTDVMYGVKTIKDGSAGEMVNPAKPAAQVNTESLQGKHLYKVSHHDFEVGEMVDRKYDWSRIPKESKFGVETPHNNDGIHVQKSLKWLHETQQEKTTKIVSKRVDDFRERTQPQLGKVHDPIKDTLRVAPDHSFGVMVKPDEYGAGDLIHMRVPSKYLRGRDRERGVLAAVRHHLKKANYHNFHDLKAAFEYYDKDKSGKISLNELREVCIQFNLPVEPELLECMLDYCDIDGDGQIDYQEFANFLNWKDKMSSGGVPGSKTKEAEKGDEAQEQTKGDVSPTRLEKQIDKAVGGWNPSSSQFNAVAGGIRTTGWRAYGVPTIRSDLPAPTTRRVADTTNYGDESDAYGLINPSIYSNHGVHEKDFFQPRDQYEIRRIFDGIGVEMTSDVFEKIWEQASTRHPSGLVSVESFRGIMDEVNAQKLAETQVA